MKKIKLLVTLFVVLAMAFAMIGCNSTPKDNKVQPTVEPGQGEPEMSETMSKILKDKKIVWGTNAAFPPFEMRNGDNVIGVDAEIAAKVAEKLGVELVVEDTDFDGLISALNAKQIDFIGAGFTIKPDREEQVLFTDKYFKAVQMIIVTEDNTDINGPADLANKIIGVQGGTTGDIVSEDIIANGTGSIVRFNSGLEAAIDLKNGRLDAVIIDNLPAQMIVAQNPGIRLLDVKADDDEEYAMAVRKEADDLQKVINEVLSELKASGEIDQWVEEYSFLQ